MDEQHELDALLCEVEGLRRLLESDLLLAAAAVEMGALGVACDVVEADLVELARFAERSGTHLPPQGWPCPAPRP